MANLLHLPDFAAAARPPAACSARRRGRVVAAAARGRVKQQEEAGKGKGRVIRVADPVREGRLPLQPPPPLFSVPVTPAPEAPESPAATGRRDDDEEERRRYYLNLGYAIRTLREEIPNVFYKEPSFDIYRDDIVFRDPFNKFEGIDNYRSLFWALRITGRIFFKALWIDIVSIWQPAENLIMIRWIAHGIPRVPWDGHGRFDGASVYKLDRNGKIYEHKVHNIATNPPTKFKGLSVEELIRTLSCPSTPKPTYFEASSQSLIDAPFHSRLTWIRHYLSLCHTLSLANVGKG
ncbi:uncharacterized protein LOC100824673 [Brachypodium distachyon]|uniref:Uncharacterized protein n=1 Tax=Brachypodium distachyon TaxID=15368 RepID=I1HDD5_BRADI|nr:uncharacterized protein LOC100824673 [Brachypodium distachyon]KQK03343.1 hypothetical protein BRADI_2g07260v3 [Brachypodium distachyon]|eukprot:XP_003565695.1 uncharacterized protein LOC100824673 [Brachypodium distachyon]